MKLQKVQVLAWGLGRHQYSVPETLALGRGGQFLRAPSSRGRIANRMASKSRTWRISEYYGPFRATWRLKLVLLPMLRAAEMGYQASFLGPWRLKVAASWIWTRLRLPVVVEREPGTVSEDALARYEEGGR